jgi:hypothetical protein
MAGNRRPGQQTRLVPATDELIARLVRDRCGHGLAPTPQAGKMTTPLIVAEHVDHQDLY